jgi:hypothetical protein
MKRLIIIYILLFVIILYSIRCTVTSKCNDAIKLKCEDQSRVIDSLNAELSMKEIEVGRYEIILDRIREKDSALVDEATSNIE